MKKTQAGKRLLLTTEKVRDLSAQRLAEVQGAGYSYTSYPATSAVTNSCSLTRQASNSNNTSVQGA